jgi:hypothetical protein
MSIQYASLCIEAVGSDRSQIVNSFIKAMWNMLRCDRYVSMDWPKHFSTDYLKGELSYIYIRKEINLPRRSRRC